MSQADDIDFVPPEANDSFDNMMSQVDEAEYVINQKVPTAAEKVNTWLNPKSQKYNNPRVQEKVVSKLRGSSNENKKIMESSSSSIQNQTFQTSLSMFGPSTSNALPSINSSQNFDQFSAQMNAQTMQRQHFMYNYFLREQELFHNQQIMFHRGNNKH